MGRLKVVQILFLTLSQVSASRGEIAEPVADSTRHFDIRSDQSHIRVLVSDGDTLSHILYALKLQLGSQVALYGRHGLIHKFAIEHARAGQELSIPLSLFQVSTSQVDGVLGLAERRPAQVDSVIKGLPAQAHMSQPSETVSHLTLLQQSTARKFQQWDIGLGVGFSRIDGEDRGNRSRATLISKISQKISASRLFQLSSDLNAKARISATRMEFDSETLNVQLRQSASLLTAFDFSFEKNMGSVSLGLGLGVDETLFYFSRTSTDITLVTRPIATAEAKVGSEIMRGETSSLTLDFVGRWYDGSETSYFSVESGFGYGASLRVRDFDSRTSCGLEFRLRQQSTSLVYQSQSQIDFDCAVQF